MALAAHFIDRPQRWDVPFGEQMTDEDVERLFEIEPFCQMDQGRFPSAIPLHGILRNDTRIVRFAPGDIIVREGDYGSSAFLILSGQVRVALESLSARLLGRPNKPRGTWWRAITQLLRTSQAIEQRKQIARTEQQPVGGVARRADANQPRVFLQDVPRVLAATETACLGPGEIFGEVAALTRSPRGSTVFAESEVELLEIRWQGLRDLMRRDDALKSHIHELYRQNSLQDHLRETPLFAHVPAENLAHLTDAARFETYGNFEWTPTLQQSLAEHPSQRIAAEPVIAEEGTAADSLLLIRSGFARLSRRHGDGHQTIAYLGKGQTYGWQELVHNFASDRPMPLDCSLRALGYVDIIRLPADLVRLLVLPFVADQELEQTLQQAKARLAARDETEEKHTSEAALKSVSLLEFLVERRFINGTQAMLIDLDRCTRCDDCVRACAATHDNNPRFIRHGPKHGRFMLANACMHCVDPVCMIGCPTGAIARDEQTGVVSINDQTCIGCTTCANACPYHNIRMVELRDERGLLLLDRQTELPVMQATKCDLCTDNLGGPACQRACPHDALIRIDVSNVDTLSQWVNR